MSIGTQKPVQFGIRLPVAWPLATPKAIARVAREAEKLGYDVVWVNDFIVWTTYQYSTLVSSVSVERAGPGVELTSPISAAHDSRLRGRCHREPEALMPSPPCQVSTGGTASAA